MDDIEYDDYKIDIDSDLIMRLLFNHIEKIKEDLYEDSLNILCSLYHKANPDKLYFISRFNKVCKKDI